MGERGQTIHVLDGGDCDALAKVGQRVAILGTNTRWTTFVPLNSSNFDCERASETLDRTLLQVWFDDDLGVAVQVYSSGSFVGEFSLPSDDDDVAEPDREFANRLESLNVLSPSQLADLIARMADASGIREWTMKHGVEKLLGLPFYDPMPTDLPETELRDLLPASAIVLEPAETATAKATKVKTRKPKEKGEKDQPPLSLKESWSETETATVDLHTDYWSDVFSMNNWKLYNRYKKHLPVDQRPDVDALVSAVGGGDFDEVGERVKSILARVWEREDWDAVVRDPSLMDGEEDVWREWVARVAGG